MEVYHHCMQYGEWKDELQYKRDAIKSIEYGDTIKGRGGTGSSTEQLAIRRVELQKKCELIEQAAIEADSDIYQYIIKAATNEYITYNYLLNVMNIPCSKNTYYDRRRKFYWILSKKI